MIPARSGRRRTLVALVLAASALLLGGCVYLRLLGIAIPGCYGPSADEMMPQPMAAD